jgi:hypothetical protein
VTPHIPLTAGEPAAEFDAVRDSGFTPRERLIILTVLAALAILAYLPALTQPLMEDDYPIIAQAQHFGDETGWSKMFAEPVFRVRATMFLFAYAINDLFDMHAPAYYAATILLHVLNTWLLFAMGAWRALGYRVTALAAGFFAVYEGHQEAVMWLAGSTEAIQMLFGLIAFLCWLRILHGGYIWYVPAVLAFAIALITKESAVIFVALFALPIVFDGPNDRASDTAAAHSDRLKKALLLIPFIVLAAASVISIAQTRVYSYRFRDGGFSFDAPFWIIWPLSFARLFWFWGALALIAILIWRPPQYRKILAIALAWAGLSLIPYSFLTYQNRVPSRHTYLPSAGIAILVGFALVILCERYWAHSWTKSRAIVIAVCAAMVIHNVAYLWTKKREQYLERAAPTEQLIALARSTKSPIYMECFPKARLTAEAAVELMVDGRSARDLVWTPQDARARNAVTFCYAPKK